MAQILDSIPIRQPQASILCRYVNTTSKIQIARIQNIPNWYFERVVFPGQHLVFEAFLEAQLEIHTGMMASSILSDCIPCEQILVEPAVELTRPETQVQTALAATSSV
jgi:hypothetical protein